MQKQCNGLFLFFVFSGFFLASNVLAKGLIGERPFGMPEWKWNEINRDRKVNLDARKSKDDWVHSALVRNRKKIREGADSPRLRKARRALIQILEQYSEELAQFSSELFESPLVLAPNRVVSVTLENGKVYSGLSVERLNREKKTVLGYVYFVPQEGGWAKVMSNRTDNDMATGPVTLEWLESGERLSVNPRTDFDEGIWTLRAGFLD